MKIFVPNHSSYFDAVSLYLSVPGLFQTLGKKEIAKIWGFGFLYKKAVILVDRDTSEGRVKAYQRMVSYLQRLNIAIFPQGTFDSTEFFKPQVYNGAFKLAKDHDVSLYPMIFLDNYKIIPPDYFWKMSPSKCRTVFLSPIRKEWIAKMNLDQAKSLYIEYMQACINHCFHIGCENIDVMSKEWLTNNINKYFS